MARSLLPFRFLKCLSFGCLFSIQPGKGSDKMQPAKKQVDEAEVERLTLAIQEQVFLFSIICVN